MNVLVTYASKHGSTAEIARVIAEGLGNAGHRVELLDATSVESIDGFDAIVLGSAIYVGQWQSPVLELVDRHLVDLQVKNVWLFSSGPIGEDPFPTEEPPITGELMRKVGAIEHKSFTGKLDRSVLGFGERLMTAALRAPEGDFRDWDAIRAWTESIAETLTESEVVTSQSSE